MFFSPPTNLMKRETSTSYGFVLLKSIVCIFTLEYLISQCHLAQELSKMSYKPNSKPHCGGCFWLIFKEDLLSASDCFI